MEFPVIKNFDELATTKLRKDALSILEAGYEAIDIKRLVHSKVSLENGHICISDTKICLADFDKVFLIAIGKCANASSEAFEEILGNKITNGISFDVKEGSFKYLLSEVGTHPFPSEKNIFVTQSIVEILKNATEKDLILTVISGGGSSLLFWPYSLDCKDYVTIARELMHRGADIHEMNTFRKHSSRIKGGQFVKLAYPATVVSFILSDVPGDDLSVVASGPTVMDNTTKEDAENVLKKYKIREDFPELKIDLIETPKEDKYFSNVRNILLGSNTTALVAMKKKAEELGYNAYIEDNKLEGDARVLGKKFAEKDYLSNSCHIWGGETTVKVVSSHGHGGRNQDFALGALPFVPKNIVVVASASDGWDNSDAAGAIVDEALYSHSKDMNLDDQKYLYDDDSYEFFKQSGGHIKTGRTGTNVADFYIVLKGK